METTTESSDSGSVSGLVHAGLSPVFTEPFDSLMDTPEENRRLVTVKAPHGLVDMFGRLYPRRLMLWVHHFDDYGVLVEGTYEVKLARRALKKAGYEPGESGLWGYRPTQIAQEQGEWPRGLWFGGRSSVAFYFDVRAGL